MLDAFVDRRDLVCANVGPGCIYINGLYGFGLHLLGALGFA